MKAALPYPYEAQRLETLRKLQLLDTPIEERFERLTRMICRLLDVPIALFNLIDDKQQFYKSAQGVNNSYASLEGAFCPHAFHEPDMLLVADTHKDERFFDNPFVTGEVLSIGFYAGCTVKTPDGMPIGTVCAIDMQPREMTEEQLQALRDITAMVESEIKITHLEHEKKMLGTELVEANRLAMVDPLTRLWNRAGMESMINKEWAEARRYKRPITIVMCDIDHFKRLNDSFGHDVGDDVIRNTGKKLIEGLRSEDHVCRVGGEEFLLILPNCDGPSAQELLERVRRNIEHTALAEVDLGRPVTLSFGVSSLVPNLDTAPGASIKAADKALYQAKEGGRNRVVLA